MKNKKGFTLIELLAVIIILGVIMLIAIPSVTRYINESRKDTYIDTARQIVKGAIPMVNGGEIDVYDTNTTYYIPASCIPTENSMSSPFGEFVNAYVIVGYTGEGYVYYWASVDKAHQGIEMKEYNKLTKGDVKPNIEAILPNIGIGNRTQIRIMDTADCITFGDSANADFRLDGDVLIDESNGNSSSGEIDLGSYVIVVPDSTNYTIYGTDTGYHTLGTTDPKDTTINPSELTLWRVIKKNDNGSFDLVSEYVSSPNACFDGVEGFANLIGELQLIAQQYGKAGYTTGTRMMGYDGQTLVITNTSRFDGSNTSIPQRSSTPKPTSGTGQEYNGGVLGDTLYLKDYILVNDLYGSVTANMVGTDTPAVYWLASRHYLFQTSFSYFYFGGNYIDTSGNIRENYLRSRGYNGLMLDNSYCYSVRPIITLRGDVEIASGTGTKNSPYILR